MEIKAQSWSRLQIYMLMEFPPLKLGLKARPPPPPVERPCVSILGADITYLSLWMSGTMEAALLSLCQICLLHVHKHPSMMNTQAVVVVVVVVRASPAGRLSGFFESLFLLSSLIAADL